MKRQAVAELQKAVAAAEAKAAELITAERLKMDRTISEVRKQAHSEAVLSVGQQEDSSEVRSTMAFLCCTFFNSTQFNSLCCRKKDIRHMTHDHIKKIVYV